MAKMRLLMKKEGMASFISHLDLMRTMRRAFIRADIPLRHSEGFNPHPVMAFALPLSVCHESNCELLDFEPLVPIGTDVFKRLCNALPEGLEVLEIYDSARKFGGVRWLEVQLTLTYDGGVPTSGKPEVDAVAMLEKHFSSPLIIHKRTKRGEADLDILPMINGITFTVQDNTSLTVRAVISAQNPTLNPAGIVDAISQLEGFAPDMAEFRRVEVYDEDLIVFR